MGQYYHPTMIDEAGNITWINTHAYGNGLKLMEHSYIGNSVMNAVFGKIKDHPLRIAWMGDYSDEEQGDVYEHKLMRTAFLHIYETVYGEDQEKHLIQPEPMAFDLDSTGWYLVNHTQRQYISLDTYVNRNKWEAVWKDWKTGETEVYGMCITADGIMVHCKANQRYLVLSGHEWVKSDDPLLAAFREDELPFVDAVLKTIDQQGYVKNTDVKAMMGKSAATAKRLLSKMVSAQLIAHEGSGRG